MDSLNKIVSGFQPRIQYMLNLEYLNGNKKYEWIVNETDEIEGVSTTLKIYYEEGSLKNESNYINHPDSDYVKRHGPYKYYFENGVLNFDQNYKNDKLDGVRKIYWENGQIRHVGNYKNGIEIGKHDTYNKNGIIIIEKKFDTDGELIETIKNKDHLDDIHNILDDLS